jgi:UDP-2,3-diacylglucosamine pyrophosphatase LpxH
VKVEYVTGNHDELLRKFVGFKLGPFRIVNKVVVPLEGKQAWIFHGDVFDVNMRHSKWLARLGAEGWCT